jgi:hypothetical protein
MACWTMGAVEGIPGLLMIHRHEDKIGSMPIFFIRNIILTEYLLVILLIVPASETNTSKSLTFARTAAPVPLSPEPNTTMRFICFGFIVLSTSQ